MELAPHAPFGASSVLGRLSQDRILTTIADSEVLSDTTTALALKMRATATLPKPGAA